MSFKQNTFVHNHSYNNLNIRGEEIIVSIFYKS